MKVLALGCCLLALLALGQAQSNTTQHNSTTTAPNTTVAFSTKNSNPGMNATTSHTAMMNTTYNMMSTEEANNGTTVEISNSTSPLNATTPDNGGPDVKASLLFSLLPLVLYMISL